MHEDIIGLYVYIVFIEKVDVQYDYYIIKGVGINKYLPSPF